MLIKVFGFHLTPSPTVGLDDLWREAALFSNLQIQALAKYLGDDKAQELPPILAKDRLVVIQDYEHIYKAGLVMKIRDAKSTFRIAGEKNGKLKVSAEQMKQGERQTEINFFLIRADSGRGLYSYYHQSSHMNDFCGTIKSIHERILARQRGDLGERHAAGSIPKRELQAALKDIKPLTYELMVRHGDASNLVKELKRIKSLRLVFEDWEEQTKGTMSPLAALSKRTAVDMSFDSDANVDSLRTLIVSAIAGKTLKRLRVEGIDPDDLDQVINLEKNLDDFNREDYDAMARSTNVDLSDLATSWQDSAPLRWLKKTAETPRVAKRLARTNQ